jgi:hypothetical protein
MAILANEHFEGGTNGAAMTTSNTIFAAVNVPTCWTFTNAQVKNGSLACQITSASNQIPNANWSNGATMNNVFLRFYIWVQSVLPSGNWYIASMLNASTRQCDLGINSDGTTMTVKIRNLNTQVFATTGAFPAAAWNRVEWNVNKGASTQTLRTFTGTAVDNPAASYTESGGGAFTQNAPDQINWGFITGETNTHYWDDWAVADNDWVGPFVPASPTPVVITHTLQVN